MPHTKKTRPQRPLPFSREAARKLALERIVALLKNRQPGIQSGATSSADVQHWLGVGWDSANKLINDDRYDPPLSTLLQVAHALDLTSIEELLGSLPLSEVLRAGRAETED